jgi:carboxyl-terminal processing protease
MKSNQMKKSVKIKLTGAFLLIISLFILAFSESKDFKYIKNLEIFRSLFSELRLFYVDEIDPDKLVKTSIDEMLKSLDPYTVYIPESKLDDFAFMTTGQYGGIGSLIRKSGDFAVISEVYKGFPADMAGLKIGDLIMEVDSKSTYQLPIEKISDLLKGLPNTEVAITIKKYGEKSTTKKILTRKKIQIKSVPFYGMVSNKTGYIRLSNFTHNSYQEVKKALTDLKEDNHAQGIIIDLRSNPGGLLVEAVNVSNLFVEKGEELVSTRSRIKEFDNTYTAKSSPLDIQIPVVILVNRTSASSSEIVAGIFQDLDRGVIIGERTYGKGLVQTTRPLNYNGQLKVTTAKYFIPSGRCIQALDYSNRNEDGSVGHIPDSLISEYTTKNGRKVYDGGGIMPDIKIIQENLGQITIELYTKSLIFDYASRYFSQHESILPPTQYEFKDSQYQDFKIFIENKNFDYKTQTEIALLKLEDLAKKEKYYQNSANEFAQLREKLLHNKTKDLEAFKNEIKNLIQEEIVGRYYYQAGRIQSSLPYDIQVKKAIEVLEDQKLYSSILQVIDQKEVAEED